VKAPPFGNLTRYILTIAKHEEWVFQARDSYRDDPWWEVDVKAQQPSVVSNGCSNITNAGFLKVEGKDGKDFIEWETPFFQTPREVYKTLRACMRRRNMAYNPYNKSTDLDTKAQRKIWRWAYDNLIVHKIVFNLHTLTATKSEINFKHDCCPKNISEVF